MKKLKLYLDTSVYNFAIAKDVPAERDITLTLLKEIRTKRYEVFISDVVIQEIDAAPEKIAAGLRKIVEEVSPAELEIDDEVEDLANRYVAEGIIPVKYIDDALHIAVASRNNIDIVVSWNFKHIVKSKTRREANAVNTLLGYKAIDISSPLEVIENV